MTVSDATTSSLNELKSLVSTTLEHAGVLARIRAQLRHHVFMAVHEQPLKADPSKPANTRGLASQLEGEERLLLDLVNEFLSIDYEYSSLTFRAESGLTQSDLPTRDQLIDKCGLRASSVANDRSKSLLLALIQRGIQSYQSGDKPVSNRPSAFSSASNSVQHSAHNSRHGSAQHSKQPSIDASSRDEFDVEAHSEPQSPVNTRQTNQTFNQSINNYEPKPSDPTPAFRSTLSSLPAFNAPKTSVNSNVWNRDDEVSSDEESAPTSSRSNNRSSSQSANQSANQSKQASDEEIEEEEPEIEVDVDEEFYESSPVSHSPIHSSTGQFNSSFATTQPSAAISAIQSKSTTQTLPNNQEVKPASSLSSLSSLPSMNSSSMGKTSLLGNLPNLGAKPAAASSSGGFGRPMLDDNEFDDDSNDQTNNDNDQYDDSNDQYDDNESHDVNDNNQAESEIDSDEEKLREIDRNIAALEAKQREQASKYLSSTSVGGDLDSASGALSRTAPINSFNSTSAFGSTLASDTFKGTKSPVADDYADEFGDDQPEVEIEEAIEEEIEEEVEIEISGDEEF